MSDRHRREAHSLLNSLLPRPETSDRFTPILDADERIRIELVDDAMSRLRTVSSSPPGFRADDEIAGTIGEVARRLLDQPLAFPRERLLQILLYAASVDGEVRRFVPYLGLLAAAERFKPRGGPDLPLADAVAAVADRFAAAEPEQGQEARRGADAIVSRLRRETERVKPPAAPDGYRFDAADPYASAHDLLSAHLAESDRDSNSYWLNPLLTKAGGLLAAATPCERAAAVAASCLREREVWDDEETRSRFGWSLRRLRESLLGLPVDFTDQDLIASAGTVAGRVDDRFGPDNTLIDAIARHAKLRPLPPAAVEHLEAARDRFMSRPGRPFADAVRKLSGVLPIRVPLMAGETWSAVACDDLEAMSARRRAAWADLLVQCQTANSGKPSAKWLKEVRAKLGAIGEEDFVLHVVRWLPLVDQTPEIADMHADVLKGLAWCSSLVESPKLARALCALAVSGYRKIPQVGPRLVKVGNAAVWALGAMPGLDAIGQLAYLKVKVKFGSAQKEIDKALAAAAEREGLPRDELEEMAVPAYGLTEVGGREEAIGEFAARLEVTGVGKTELTWLTPSGKRQKSVPAAVKQEFADDLKDLKAAAKDIEKMLPAQRDRIDTLYLDRKAWPVATWRERYLDHPLVGVVARRLIWRFVSDGTTTDAIWYEGGLVDRSGRRIDDIADATVSLWHPIGEPVETVLEWRRFLEDREIRQPFKQAHREVYLLTDAERNTGVYSNRFAAHVLKQHQFHALCGVRGWKNSLRLMVDDEFPPATKSLPRWGLRAEYWIEGAGDEYGRDTNEAGTFLYLATDQVRFYRLDAAANAAHASGGGYTRTWGQPPAEPLPLDEVSPLAFSEVMRDVDLFVGVASVGNDPTWADGGPQGRYRDYWNRFGFGDLSATAQTRKAVLERLIPRLKIADRCGFTERFLVVRGDLRTYKVHLGSGNIHMEPNDEYLCIVPKAGDAGAAGDKLYLPFEGDRTLSIILSKALMLADDGSITDPTITRQIRRAE